MKKDIEKKKTDTKKSRKLIEARDKARQKTLQEMSWLDELRPLESPILLFYLAMFFHACRFPFEVLDNYRQLLDT